MNKNLYRVQKSMQNVGNILIIYIYILQCLKNKLNI